MEWVVGIVVALAAVAFVAWPLWKNFSTVTNPATGAHPETEWEKRKREALAAIKEAEFDLAMGKLSEQDFAQLRERYLRMAAQAIAEQEKQAHRTAKLTGAANADIAPGCPACAAGQSRNWKFCPQCGQPLAA